jgi:hypothetical protein
LDTKTLQDLRLSYPRRIGLAADLMFIVTDRRAFLADCLLVYDNLVIPTQYTALHALYSTFQLSELQRLLDARRISFCPGISWGSRLDKSGVTHSQVVSEVWEHFRHDRDQRLIVKQVEHHLLMGTQPDYQRWTNLFAEASEVFNQAAERPGYEWLYPVDLRSSYPRRDRIVGLETGLARISDLVAAGVTDLEMDGELSVLLEICFPASRLSNITESSAQSIEARNVVERLHRLNNLPPIGEYAAERKWTNDELIDVLLGDHATRLRDWLKENTVPGIDVRDAYIDATGRLPSKEKWNGWLRFGTVTGVSAAIGTLLGGPIGAASGLAVGVLDQAVGENLQRRIADPYHPDSWLSFIKRA